MVPWLQADPLRADDRFVQNDTATPSTQRTTRSRLVAALSTLALAATLLVAGAPAAAAAPPSRGQAELEFLQLLNQTRVDHGLAPLESDGLIVPIAREWSGQMAASSVLSHRPDLRAQIEGRVTREWYRIGENVGRGGGVASLHTAFMNSPGHKANVLGDYNRVGIGVVISGSTIWVTFNFLHGAEISGATGMDLPAGDLWLASEAGEVWAFGQATDHGSLAGQRLAAPIVGMVATPSRGGYWLVGSDGGIYTFGDAGFFGSTGALRLNRPIVGMAPTSTGRGYWLVASDGGIFAFGDAAFRGSTGGTRLNRPVLGMAATPSGDGYWLTASDGGIFSFGDARFLGSTGGTTLNRPVTGMVSTPSGDGYWLTGSDGGLFSFGDAAFFGSTGGAPLAAPIAGIAVTETGRGYKLVGRDGRVFSFGDAGSDASGPIASSAPIVAVALP